jgi:hypothetical protein
MVVSYQVGTDRSLSVSISFYALFQVAGEEHNCYLCYRAVEVYDAINISLKDKRFIDHCVEARGQHVQCSMVSKICQEACVFVSVLVGAVKHCAKVILCDSLDRSLAFLHELLCPGCLSRCGDAPREV